MLRHALQTAAATTKTQATLVLLMQLEKTGPSLCVTAVVFVLEAH